MDELTGRVAVVTGAASGIGFALARRFAEEGMKLVLADVEAGALRNATDELAAKGGEVIGVEADVSRSEDVARLADETLDAFGKVHVVCNNAGVFVGGCTWESPLSDYEWVLGVNLWGVIHGVRTFLPILLRQGEPAHVVNTASMAGVTGAPFVAAYAMSKHAVVALSETLYYELAGQAVGVSVLCPELVNTGIGRSARNRPKHLQRIDVPPDPARDLVEGVLASSVEEGVDPSRMAERVVDAIRNDRFYILAEPGGSWRAASDGRCEDVRLGRNPSSSVGGAK